MSPSDRDPESRFRKYDIVIGIIGNTQGVKIDARPKPRAVSRKGNKSSSLPPAGFTGTAALGDTSIIPAGTGKAAAAPAATVNVATAVFFFGGRHSFDVHA